LRVEGDHGTLRPRARLRWDGQEIASHDPIDALIPGCLLPDGISSPGKVGEGSDRAIPLHHHAVLPYQFQKGRVDETVPVKDANHLGLDPQQAGDENLLAAVAVVVVDLHRAEGFQATPALPNDQKGICAGRSRSIDSVIA
jgi:hypothetical protein